MPKLIKKILKLVLHFENWPLRFLELMHLAPKKLLKMSLRNGTIFFVRAYSSDISCLQSITMENEYFPYFNVMPGDTVIDIGANIGSFSVSVAYREPSAKIYAIEPVKNNYNLLCQNIELNHLTNVSPINVAISDKREELTIYHGLGSWFASGSFYKVDATDPHSSEEVSCITLEDIFIENEIGNCDFLKMDCEGAEYKILFSLSDELLRKIKKIAIEFHNFESDNKQHDIVKFLESKQYRVILPRKYQNKEIGLVFAIKQ